MKDVLSEIIAHKKIEVEAQKTKVSVKELEKSIEKLSRKPRSLKEALLQSETGIIAEFKRKSPSKGWINQHAIAAEVVLKYEKNGAAAISVLTDTDFFGGSMEDLRTAREKVSIPLLRKEFIVDEYQIFEAKAHGADAILLIAAAISIQESLRFTELARSLGLDVLLELHDESEIDYISPANNIVGINNRNLGSFVTDVEKSFNMIPLLPKEAVLVSESGISHPETVKELRRAGYKGFLIGENFMKTEKLGESLGEFVRMIR